MHAVPTPLLPWKRQLGPRALQSTHVEVGRLLCIMDHFILVTPDNVKSRCHILVALLRAFV